MNKTDFSQSATYLALDCDILKDIKRYKKSLYDENPYLSFDKVLERIYLHFTTDLGIPFELIKEGVRMCENSYRRKVRCLEKTNNIILDNKTVFFGTLTFTNEVLDKTTPETRRRYVSRYLKSISDSYIANIDFGDKEKNPQSNEREHYHCLVAAEDLPSSWSYGFCKFIKVSQDEASPKRITSYINKLTNHALKLEKTGKAKRLIYSRGYVAPYWLLV
jgi:hypothetical protein